MIVLMVERVPLYIGPTTSWWEAGSEREWICSWRRILTTSRGATQNLFQQKGGGLAAAITTQNNRGRLYSPRDQPGDST